MASTGFQIGPYMVKKYSVTLNPDTLVKPSIKGIWN